jgi:hypothetical protein
MMWKPLIGEAALACLSAIAIAQTPKPAAEGDCAQWMQCMDADDNGVLNGTEAAAFVEKMSAANTPPATAGTVTKEEFMAACQKGGFEGMAQ